MGHFSGHFAIRAWSFASSLVKQTRASASLLLSLVKLMAKITVYPSFKTVIDQKVDIFVSNLPSNQDILLRARTIDDSETVFESFAHYKADENGEVSLVSQPSLGGSYTGVEPMGLFWSMEPPGGTDRDDMLRKRDVTKRMLLKRGTGSGERGTGNGSLGTSCQRKPPQKSKMAV